MTNLESDVREYLEENPRQLREFGPYEGLTPHDKLRMFLEWNGIMGWDTTIVSVLTELGWTPPRVPPEPRSPDLVAPRRRA